MGDTETTLSLISGDVMFLVPGRRAMQKADFAAASRPPGRLGLPADPAHGGRRAAGGASIVRARQILSVLKKEDGRRVISRNTNFLSVVPEE